MVKTETTTVTKLGIGFRPGIQIAGATKDNRAGRRAALKLNRKKGNLNQTSKHKMRTSYGVVKKKQAVK